jgi:hypothetical protein
MIFFQCASLRNGNLLDSIIETIKIVSRRRQYHYFGPPISFLFIALLFRDQLAVFLHIDVQYVTYAIWILVFDALVIIPFQN